MDSRQAVILHGGLTDLEQQTVVDNFKQASSPIRVLITGDLASEGVNLHAQCHELIHFDIPWSLIRIEQRNGRIDRYEPAAPAADHDAAAQPGHRDVLRRPAGPVSRLIEKEHEAHSALGDAASLMGKYDVGAEEDEIRKVLAGKASLDDVVQDTQAVKAEDSVAGMLARIMAGAASPGPATDDASTGAGASSSLYPSQVAFLRDALEEAYKTPAAPVAAGGVDWRDYGPQQIVELVPPPTCGSGLRSCRRPTSPSGRWPNGSSSSPPRPAARRYSPTPSRTSRNPPGPRRTTSARCTRSSTGPPTGRWPASAATRSSPPAATWSTRPSCCSAR